MRRAVPWPAALLLTLVVVDALANTAIARQLDTLELAGLGEHQVERVVTKRALFPALKRLGVLTHGSASLATRG